MLRFLGRNLSENLVETEYIPVGGKTQARVSFIVFRSVFILVWVLWRPVSISMNYCYQQAAKSSQPALDGEKACYSWNTSLTFHVCTPSPTTFLKPWRHYAAHCPAALAYWRKETEPNLSYTTNASLGPFNLLMMYLLSDFSEAPRDFRHSHEHFDDFTGRL